MSDLPIVGAALTLKELPHFRTFMEEKARDLELQDFHRPEIMANGLEDLTAHARKLLAGYPGRIGIHGPFWDFNIATWGSEFRSLIQTQLLAAVRACGRIGGSHMVVHSPFTIWDAHNVHNYPGAVDAVAMRATETLAPVIVAAQDEGVMLVLENCEDIDVGARVSLARSFGTEAVRVSVDTGHAEYAHGRHAAPPVDYFIKAAGDLLHHVHLQDADGYADRHWQIGTGTVNWRAVFAALPATSPRLILELRDKSQIEASVAYLHDAGLAQ